MYTQQAHCGVGGAKAMHEPVRNNVNNTGLSLNHRTTAEKHTPVNHQIGLLTSSMTPVINRKQLGVFRATAPYVAPPTAAARDTNAVVLHTFTEVKKRGISCTTQVLRVFPQNENRFISAKNRV